MRIGTRAYTLRRPGRAARPPPRPAEGASSRRSCVRVLKRALKRRKASVRITLRASDSTGNSPKAVSRTVRVSG